MYGKKRNKVCPFCRGRINKVYDKLVCESCESELSPQAMDTKTKNMMFFNGHR